MKKISTELKSLIIIIVAVLTVCIFGFGSVSKFVFNKFLFTPENIIGIVMTVVTIFGGYLAQQHGHWIKWSLTALSGLVSLFSYTCTILTWFDIDLVAIIWKNVLTKDVMTAGSIILWIVIVVVALLLTGFTVYSIVKFVKKVKTDHEWQEDQIRYKSQKALLNRLAGNNKIAFMSDAGINFEIDMDTNNFASIISDDDKVNIVDNKNKSLETKQESQSVALDTATLNNVENKSNETITENSVKTENTNSTTTTLDIIEKDSVQKESDEKAITEKDSIKKEDEQAIQDNLDGRIRLNTKSEDTQSEQRPVKKVKITDEQLRPVTIKEKFEFNDFELLVSNNICPMCGGHIEKHYNRRTKNSFFWCTNFGIDKCGFVISHDKYMKIFNKYH